MGVIRRRVTRGLALALGLTGLFTSDAYADDTHYHNYPLGGRAVGLGGAFVALANDPSGLYYNPAGIVDGRHRSVQLGTNLYGLEVSDTLVQSFGVVGDLETVFADLTIIPSSAAFTGVLESDADGRPVTSYALGSFIPTFRSLNVDSASETSEGPCQQLSYQRSLLDRTFLFGAAAGHRLDDTWQFGASAFLAYRNLRDREEVSCFGAPTDNGSSFSAASTSLNLAAASILLSFGIKAKLGHGLTLGGTVTSPSIPAFDRGSLRVRRGAAGTGDGASQSILRELDDLSANTRYGTAIRLGLAWVQPKSITLAFDIDIRAPTKYQLVELPSNAASLRDLVTITTDVERKPVVNLNLGAEYLFRDDFSLAVGFFTNFSSAPSIPGATGEAFDQDYLPDLDTYGGSVVAGFFGEYTLTRLGLLVSYGSGADVVPRSEGLTVLGQATDFVKVDYNQLFLYAFLSSTFRY